MARDDGAAQTPRSCIHAIMKQPSLVDYPGHLSVLMFTSGCNFRCGFCHNPDLLSASPKCYAFEALAARLPAYRESWVKAISITGGEPTLHANLPETVRFFKENGFLVKVDTNGSSPEMLRRILPLADYIAMDMKCALEHYGAFVGYDKIERIRESIALVISSAKDYEFRTTVLEGMHTEEEIRRCAEELRGAKRWFFQPFIPHPNLPEEGLRDAKRTAPSVLQRCVVAAREIVPAAQAR